MEVPVLIEKDPKNQVFVDSDLPRIFKTKKIYVYKNEKVLLRKL
jgi:hypothetical protein